MSTIAVFSIPAFGHTNPLLPVTRELTARGHKVRFYSFDLFQERIQQTGAAYISLDQWLEEAPDNLRHSNTQMFLEDVRLTGQMTPFLQQEMERDRPDLILSDSVCFWGKLTAWKHHIPLVVSTTTFAFNQQSSKEIKQDGKELLDSLLGWGKMKKALKTLEPLGYPRLGPLDLIASKPEQDTLVYVTRAFQPAGESFPDNYCFVGPSVFVPEEIKKEEAHTRKRIYASLGTVVNDNKELFRKLVQELGRLDADVVLACPFELELPDNITRVPFANQMEELAKADLFVTHAGMNSVSEAMYMGVPMVLLPQTGEQRAVANAAVKAGCGRTGLEQLGHILEDGALKERCRQVRETCRAAGGAAAAADYVESVLQKKAQ